MFFLPSLNSSRGIDGLFGGLVHGKPLSTGLREPERRCAHSPSWGRKQREDCRSSGQRQAGASTIKALLLTQINFVP